MIIRAELKVMRKALTAPESIYIELIFHQKSVIQAQVCNKKTAKNSKAYKETSEIM